MLRVQTDLEKDVSGDYLESLKHRLSMEMDNTLRHMRSGLPPVEYTACEQYVRSTTIARDTVETIWRQLHRCS